MRSTSLRVYSWILRLLPAGFRDSYAAEMEREFRDSLAESGGAGAISALWLRLLWDLALTIPAQAAREIGQDVRHTLRLWAGRPWHTSFAIAALAIGIGANTGVFSVVNALLLRSLPFGAPERLAWFDAHYFIPPHDSAAEFEDWRQNSAYLADAALLESKDVNVGGAQDAQRVLAAQTSWNFFATLGVKPVLGRTFAHGEDTAGRDGLVVIGYGLWQQLFAGDARVLGSTLRVDGNPLTVIGVAPPGFDYPKGTSLWKAAVFTQGNNGWYTVARLKPGISWPWAREAFNADVERIAPRRPGDRGPRPRLESLQDALAGPARQGSLMLMAGVVLVLLIACTNVANLLMARTADRTPEFAIRSALGASRARLVQQLLTECLLLSLVAAAAGMAVAFTAASMAAKVQPPALALQSYSLVDGRVLAFAAGVSILSALLFGALPSLHLGRLYEFNARGSSAPRGSRLVRDMLAGAQVMLTVVLLTASVSVGRAFIRLLANDRGYDVQNVVTASASLAGTLHQNDGRELAYFEEVLARLRRLPGVRSASATDFLPLYATGFVGGPFGLDGRPPGRNSTMIPVLSGYFETMGGRILSGREFTDEEVRSGARVALVNESFAARFGTSPEELVGRQLTAGRRPPYKIVGVARTMSYSDTDPTMVMGVGQVFLPAATPGGFFSTFVVRVDGRAEDHLAAVRDTVRSVDPQVPVYGVKTMQQRLDDIFARPKFYRTVLWIFAGFAVLLAVIGIYGIVSYTVVQRTREMGVRLALGTTPVHLRGMLLRQGLLTVAAGALPGLAAARLSGRFLESLIQGARSVDVATSVAVVLFLASVAAASIWTATRRIARLDVIEILRAE